MSRQLRLWLATLAACFILASALPTDSLVIAGIHGVCVYIVLATITPKETP